MKVSTGIFWDIENSKVPNELRDSNGLQITTKDAIKNIQQALISYLPNSKIVSFIACGNIKAVTEEQRKHIYEGGATLFDVPTGTKDAADHEVMLQMFKYSKENPPPSYLILMSGDSDMCRAVERLTYNGHTTLLAFPANITYEGLKFCSDYSISCNHLFAGTITDLNQPSQTPEPHLELTNRMHLKLSPPQVVEHGQFDENSAIVFWDAETCTINQIQCNEHIEYIMVRVQQNVAKCVQIRVYGDRTKLPQQQSVKGVIYKETSITEKENSLVNTLMVELLDCATSCGVPRNIVLMTGKNEFSRATHFLQSLEFKIFIVSPYGSDNVEEYLAPSLFKWPPRLTVQQRRTARPDQERYTARTKTESSSGLRRRLG